MINYKIRIFSKNLLTKDGVIGSAKIRKGNKNKILKMVKEELPKSRKIIIEVI